MNIGSIQKACSGFSIDKTDISFNKITIIWIRKSICERNRALNTQVAWKVLILDRMTVITVVIAARRSLKSVVVIPGKKPHYRKLGNGVTDRVHEYIPPCYFFHRDPARVDRNILYRCAQLYETCDLRRSRQKQLLVYDGYRCHLYPRALMTLEDAGIITIAMDSHLSHLMQPLDVAVFQFFMY